MGQNKKKPYIDPIIGRYKSAEYLDVLQRWLPAGSYNSLLKTDLREEAFGADQVLFSLEGGQGRTYGMDIDAQTVQTASLKSSALSRGDRFVACDARQMPFRSGAFDAVFSPSTLDHFRTDEEFLNSLKEMRRVLRTGGVFVLAMNNRKNIPFLACMSVISMLCLRKYSDKFYSLEQLEHFCVQAGFRVEESQAVVVMLSPLNMLMLLLRRCCGSRCADMLSGIIVKFMQRAGRNRNIRQRLGWFVALKCKVPEGGKVLEEGKVPEGNKDRECGDV